MKKILGWLFDALMARPNRLFAQAVESPRSAQTARLHSIIAANAGCSFGNAHEFSRLSGLRGDELVAAYRRSVPIRPYDGFLPWINRMRNGETGQLVRDPLIMFSMTSGTSSDAKYCPVTRRFILEHHRSHLLWMHKVHRDHPTGNAGRYLVVTGPAVSGFTPGGVPFGSMSGRQLQDQSIPLRRRQAVPVEAFSLPDPVARWRTVLARALAAGNLSIVLAVNPATLVMMANRLRDWGASLLDDLERDRISRKNGGAKPTRNRLDFLRDAMADEGCLRPETVWPELAVVLTWLGGSAPFYLPRVSRDWGEKKARRCLGLRASEGTFTIPLRDHDPAGVLAVSGHFMEFLPEDAEPVAHAQTLTADELEIGKCYRMVVTTSGGFYRYDLADVVEVRGFVGRTPQVAFVRRAGAVVSVTGEKVTEDQVTEAMRRTRGNFPAITGFTVTLRLDETPQYVLAVEWPGMAGNGAALPEWSHAGPAVLAMFERQLREINKEYDGKRADGRLAHPCIQLLADGTFDAHRADETAGDGVEGQIKPMHLVGPREWRRGAGMRFFEKARVVDEIQHFR